MEIFEINEMDKKLIEIGGGVKREFETIVSVDEKHLNSVILPCGNIDRCYLNTVLISKLS